ncbi:MAG: type II toxin-antitoxin system PemK/MazF family toxin [Candidatus Taylorbacteria bacterium]
MKQKLSTKKAVIFCNEREIWWCSIGMNIGTELFGKNELYERPVLIFKVYNRETVTIIPLTSNRKEGVYYSDITVNSFTSQVVLSQVRVISTKRLSRKIGRISKENFFEIKNKYLHSL